MNQIIEYLVNWGLREGITWHSKRGKGNYIRKENYIQLTEAFAKLRRRGNVSLLELYRNMAIRMIMTPQVTN